MGSRRAARRAYPEAQQRARRRIVRGRTRRGEGGGVCGGARTAIESSVCDMAVTPRTAASTSSALSPALMSEVLCPRDSMETLSAFEERSPSAGSSVPPIDLFGCGTPSEPFRPDESSMISAELLWSVERPGRVRCVRTRSMVGNFAETSSCDVLAWSSTSHALHTCRVELSVSRGECAARARAHWRRVRLTATVGGEMVPRVRRAWAPW